MQTKDVKYRVVKHLTRYTIPVILFVIAFISGASGLDLPTKESCNKFTSPEQEVVYLDSSTPQSSLNLPRQFSGVTPIHMQVTITKRSSNAHRHNFEFVKSGKIINAGIRNLIQKESLNICSSFTKPVHKLICLGKLII